VLRAGLFVVLTLACACTAAAELTAMADRVEQLPIVARVPAPLAKGLSLNEGTVIQANAYSFGTSTPRDIQGIQVFRVNGKRHVMFARYKDDWGAWYLSDDSGRLVQALQKNKTGPLEEVAPAVRDAAFGAEKAFWLERYKAGAIVPR
jgi:hypothetical protein